MKTGRAAVSENSTRSSTRTSRCRICVRRSIHFPSFRRTAEFYSWAAGSVRSSAATRATRRCRPSGSSSLTTRHCPKTFAKKCCKTPTNSSGRCASASAGNKPTQRRPELLGDRRFSFVGIDQRRLIRIVPRVVLELPQALLLLLLFAVLFPAILLEIVVRLLCQRVDLRKGQVQDNSCRDWCRGSQSGMLVGS